MPRWSVLSVVLLLLMLVVLLSASALYAQTSDRTYSIQSQAKKLISFEYAPTAHWVAQNIATMEQQPFDGMIMAPGRRLKGLFDYTNWSADPEYLDTAALNSIAFDSFTDNFIEVPPFNDLSPSVSYWNDSHWNQICANLAAVASYINGNSRFKGIVVDIECISETETGTNPWDWRKMKAGHTEAQTKAKCRERGGQVMRAMLDANPDLVIYAPFMFEYLPTEWNLVDDWLNGWLDALDEYPQARIIDGRKESYYYGDTGKFFSSHRIEDAIDPANLTTFRNQVQVGRSVYADLCFNVYIWENYTPPLTKPEQSQRWQHCIYNGLATTDQYTRVFMDNLRFPGWENTAKWNWDNLELGVSIVDVTTPPTDAKWNGDADTAAASARAAYNNRNRLGWDVVGAEMWNAPASIDASVTVNITAPAQGATFNASDTITVTATASGGTITKMEFYQNAQKVGEDTVAPYTFTLTFKEGGDHTLFARATNSAGSHGTSQPVVIHINPGPPVADFSGNPTSGPAPLTVYFTDLSSGNPTSWSWTFGDGGSSQAQNPSHQYTTANQYTVSLTATNQSGPDTETKTNYITVIQAQDYTCASAAVNTGTLKSGDHTSVHASDNVYLVVGSAKVANKQTTQVTYTFNTGLGGLSYLKFTVEGKVSAGSQPQTVYVYNYSTSTWDSKSSSTLTTTDSTVAVEVTSPANYISGGTVQVRVKAGGTGSTAFDHSTDLVKITAAP